MWHSSTASHRSEGGKRVSPSETLENVGSWHVCWAVRSTKGGGCRPSMNLQERYGVGDGSNGEWTKPMVTTLLGCLFGPNP